MNEKELRRSERIIQTIEMKRNVKNETKSEANEGMSGKKSKNRQKFICDKCSSNRVKDPMRKISKNRNNSKPKICFDSVLQKTLKVCNNCAKRMTRLHKSNEKTPKVSAEEHKRKYLLNCHSFGVSLVQLLNDSSAERLYCPNLKGSGNACACLQRYVIGMADNLDDKQQRAQHLLDLLTEAKRLSQQKCYSIGNPKSGQKIGLGNGHKKSKQFEDFVNNRRNYLRNELHFCERAAQRVLFYSNNFLHKKLKTDTNGRQRAERLKGKAVKGKLVDIKLLSNQLCCGYECIKLGETHPNLLDNWRQRAAVGQLEARRVLAEMLTPTQANRTNCFKFISLVTGTSIRTIHSVEQYLRSNGGNREPIEHQLKKFWNKETVSETNDLNPNESIHSNEEVVKSPTNVETLGSIGSTNSLQQNYNRIHLLINNTNQEISVISDGREQTIAILSPQINFVNHSSNTTSDQFFANDFNL